MKICVIGIPGIKPGKHNLKDPRLDQADKLVEASKKTYAQVDVGGEEAALEADAFLVTPDTRADLILKDLEFVETRLSRSPLEAEKSVLEKIRALLESDQFIAKAGLSQEALQAVAAHSFFTNKPIVVASSEDLQNPEGLLLRAFKEAGYITFLTVGGKENLARAAPPGKLPARFIRIFRRASSAPRSSASMISSRPAAKRRPNGRANSVWKRRI